MAVSLLLLMPASAQHRASENGIARHIEMMTQQLELSQEQADKIAELLREFANSEEGDAAALHEAVSQVLTPKQRERIQDHPITMANRFRSSPTPRDASARASRARRARAASRAPQAPTLALVALTRALDLTEEQQEQLKEAQTGIQQAAEEQMAAVEQVLRDVLTLEQYQRMMELRERRTSRSQNVRSEHSNRFRRSRGRMAPARHRMTRRGQATQRWHRNNRQVGRRQATMPMGRMSAAQREALEVVRRAMEAKRRAFAQDNPEASAEDKRAFAANQRETFAAAMDSVLTVEQRLRMVMQHVDRHAESRSRLGLIEAQKAQLEAVLAEHGESARAWRQANPDATPAARMQHAQTQIESLHNALKEVLSEEQYRRLSRDSAPRPRRSRRIR